MGNSRNGTVYVFGLAVALFGMTTGLSLGAEWKAVNAGLTNMDIRSLAIDPAHPTNIYAGTRNGLFKSMDGGAGWRSSGLRDTATIHLVIDFVNPNILYAGTAPALAEPSCSGGCYCSDPLLFKSMDGGASWSSSIRPPDQGCDSIRALLLDPSDANTLYYAAYSSDGHPPLWKSTDGGVTWNHLAPWRYPADVVALAINPLPPSNLYAAGNGFPSASGVFTSTDGGMTWSITGLRDPFASVLAIDPRNPSTLYAGTIVNPNGGFGPSFQGLFKSTDSGASWLAINHGLSDLIGTQSSISALVIDPDTPSTLYAATLGNGVFKSSDGGASWIRFSDGLSNRNVRALALAPGASGPNILYAGTSGAGVFKILDDGLVTDPFPVSHTFFVPIIVSSLGVGGEFYESELTLANRSTRDATVEFTYTAAFGGGSGQTRTTLEAGRQQIAPDAITYLRQLGIPIPASGSRGGTLRVRFYGLPSPNEVAVLVRTTTPVAEGRAGVGYAGLPMASWGGYMLYELRQDASFRTNVALQNAGEAQDGDITLRLEVFSSNPPNESPEIVLHCVIPPGGFYQINEILHSNGLSMSSGHVSVQRINGYAPFYAYAVTHNQASSDAFYIPPASRISSRLTIPTIPRRQDGFKSELVLMINPFNFVEDIKFSISFQAVEQETFAVRANITLKPHEQRIFPDVESWLRDFGLPLRQRPYQGVKGPLVFTEDRIGGLGTLFFSLGLRVSALNKGGEYSLFFPAIPAGQESRSATWLFGLQQNAETRSNLAIVNLGTEPNRFRIELFNGETGIQAGRLEDLSVNAQGSLQLNSLLADYAPGVTQGYAQVVPSSSEPFVAYAVVIDGARPGERTGDGSLINSFP